MLTACHHVFHRRRFDCDVFQQLPGVERFQVDQGVVEPVGCAYMVVSQSYMGVSKNRGAYIWLIFMVNLGKYTIHGLFGLRLKN